MIRHVFLWCGNSTTINLPAGYAKRKKRPQVFRKIAENTHIFKHFQEAQCKYLRTQSRYIRAAANQGQRNWRQRTIKNPSQSAIRQAFARLCRGRKKKSGPRSAKKRNIAPSDAIITPTNRASRNAEAKTGGKRICPFCSTHAPAAAGKTLHRRPGSIQRPEFARQKMLDAPPQSLRLRSSALPRRSAPRYGRSRSPSLPTR